MLLSKVLARDACCNGHRHTSFKDFKCGFSLSVGMFPLDANVTFINGGCRLPAVLGLMVLL